MFTSIDKISNLCYYCFKSFSIPIYQIREGGGEGWETSRRRAPKPERDQGPYRILVNQNLLPWLVKKKGGKMYHGCIGVSVVPTKTGG